MIKPDGPFLCEECGEEEAGAHVEAFETFGKLVCEECASALFDKLGDEQGAGDA